MNFPKDMLAELDTPTRLFRTHIHNRISPFRPKTQSPLLETLFVRKRETLELDDIPHFSSTIKNEFFGDDILVYKKPVISETELETTCIMHQIRVDLVHQCKEPGITFPSDFKKIKTVTNWQTDVNSLQLDNTRKEAISDDPDNPKINKIVESPELQPIEDSKLTPKEVSVTANQNNYNNIVQQRKASILVGTQARKRLPFSSQVTNQLRTRALRVSSFWRRDNNFIPSVFRLVQLVREPKRGLVELQDFSLKGLCHVDDSFGEENLGAELDKQLDMLGDDTLCDSYEIGVAKLNY